MKTTIRYVLLCALQDRLFYGIVALTAAVAGIAVGLGSTAFIEQKETMIAFTVAANRIILVVASVLFVCFNIHSSFEQKHMDVMLSRPISRQHVVIAHWLGFALISVLMLLPVYGMILMISPPDMGGLNYWALTMILELWVMIAFSLFASFILRSAVVSVLATLAFYVVSRMMVLFLMTAERGGSVWGLREVIEWIAVLIPRLDMFAKSEWLIYGPESTRMLSLIGAQSTIFIGFLLVLCIIDFRKKEF